MRSGRSLDLVGRLRPPARVRPTMGGAKITLANRFCCATFVFAKRVCCEPVCWRNGFSRNWFSRKRLSASPAKASPTHEVGGIRCGDVTGRSRFDPALNLSPLRPDSQNQDFLCFPWQRPYPKPARSDLKPKSVAARIRTCEFPVFSLGIHHT